jgi:type 1 fimbria pilin
MFRSRSRSRSGSILIAVLVLLMLSAGSVAADTAPGGGGTFTQNGTTGDVYTSSCTPNGDDTSTCEERGLSVFTGRMSESISGVSHRDQVCVYLSTYTADDRTGELVGDPVFESGCAVDVPSGTVTVGKNLTSIRLSATTVEVYQFVCDKVSCEPGPSRDVRVVGTWTGFGSIFASKYRSSSDDGLCRSHESGKGSSREASFAGNVDGDAFGDDAYASIASGKFTFRSRCIEA